MGHRANFIVIRNAHASAYHDQWAALGSAFLLTDGPERAAAAMEPMEPTDELLDWGFAEGGFLLDFDDRVLIAFGYPEPIDLDEFDGEFGDPLNDAEMAETTSWNDAFNAGADGFLQRIAPAWKGWLLVWDDRGVDAFAEHLQSRRIEGIKTQPPSHPPGREAFRVQA